MTPPPKMKPAKKKQPTPRLPGPASEDLFASQEPSPSPLGQRFEGTPLTPGHNLDLEIRTPTKLQVYQRPPEDLQEEEEEEEVFGPTQQEEEEDEDSLPRLESEEQQPEQETEEDPSFRAPSEEEASEYVEWVM